MQIKKQVFLDNLGTTFDLSLGKINSKLTKVIATPQPTPTPTGNTTNLNSTFKDFNGDTYIVDNLGNSIKAGATSAVRYGSATPTITTGDKANDTYLRTTTGTSSGEIQTEYKFDGTVWKLTNVTSDPIVDVVGVTPLPVVFPVTTLPGSPVFTPNVQNDKDTIYRLADGTMFGSNGTQYTGTPPVVGLNFNNGLIKSGSTVKLGGFITEKVEIMATNANELIFSTNGTENKAVLVKKNNRGVIREFHGNGSPTGVVTPLSKGDEYTDLLTGDKYISSGLTVNSWTGYYSSTLEPLTLVNKTTFTGAANTVENGGKTFTVPTSGRYMFYAWISTVGGTQMNTNTFSIRNGATILGTDVQQAFTNGIHCPHLHLLEVDLLKGITYNAIRSGSAMDGSDYITIKHRQVTTSSVTVIPAGAVTALALHSCKLRRVAAQPIPSDVDVAITFDTQDDNPFGIGKIAANDAIVISQSGSYNVNFRGGFNGIAGITSTTSVSWRILKNGATIANTQDNGGLSGKNYLSGVTALNLSLVAGDLLSFQLFQNSGAVKNSGTLLQEQPTVELTQNPVNVTSMVLPLRVYSGTGLPNIFQPTATPNEGDTFVQTANGLPEGTLQSSWVYSATAGLWVRTGSQAVQIATTNSVRTYYPQTSAYVYALAAGEVSSAQIALWGLEGFGGYQVIPYAGGSLWNGYSMMEILGVGITNAQAFTAPVSYIRHTIAVTPNENNTYFLNFINEQASRSNVYEVWICDPITKLPLPNGRLHAMASTPYISNPVAGSYLRSPKNTPASNVLDEWFSYNISKDLINQYKTADNNIVLAWRKGANCGGDGRYFRGFAMAVASKVINFQSALGLGNWGINEIVVNTGNGGNALIHTAVYGGFYNSYIPVNQTRNLRLYITDKTKDIWLTFAELYRNEDGMGHNLDGCDVKIKHSSGDVSIEKPRHDIFGPATDWVRQGARGTGWVLPSTLYGSKTTKPVGSAIEYLTIEINSGVQNPNNRHFAGIMTEEI